MGEGIEKVLARRIWFVPEVMIWGTGGLGDLDYLVFEKVGTDGAVLYGQSSLFDGRQQLLFGNLNDHRGNKLPDALQSPRVLLRSRSSSSAFVVGPESSTGVTVARDPDADGPVMADVLVVEMGD